MRIHAAWLWVLFTPSLPMAAAQAARPERVISLFSSDTVLGQTPSPPPANKLPEPKPFEEAPVPRSVPAGDSGPGTDGLPSCSFAELKENFLKLKAERDGLQAERLALAQKPFLDASLAEDNVKLRLRLSEILARLGTRTKKPSATAPSAPEKTPGKGSPPGTADKSPLQQPETLPRGGPAAPDRPLDPLALAHVLFKAENYDSALRAYRLIDLRGMKAEDRLPIKYLIATCLKRLGKAEEAAAIFRDIANSRGDENIATCAQWQLSALRWQEEMRGQLDTLRQRRKALENRP